MVIEEWACRRRWPMQSCDYDPRKGDTFMTWVFLSGAVWLAVGIYAVASVYRNRLYVRSLPQTPGNQKMVRGQKVWLALGLLAILVGLWRLFAYLG